MKLTEIMDKLKEISRELKWHTLTHGEAVNNAQRALDEAIEHIKAAIAESNKE